MKAILVTGSGGFIGQNLCVALRRQGNYKLLEFGSRQSPAELVKLCKRADLVFHLAGVNRPKHESEFQEGNANLTRRLCEALTKAGRKAPLVVSSSIHAELDNAYGRSKREAEEAVLDYNRLTGAPAYLFRFPNVFGKWCRPNYNSAVATFCYNISRDIPVQVVDPGKQVKLVYVDDVIRMFLEIAAREKHDLRQTRFDVPKTYLVTVGELRDTILSFYEARKKSTVPDLSNPFIQCLYATYVAAVDPKDLITDVPPHSEHGGTYFDLTNASLGGQTILCRAQPGSVLGNHYHDTACEKCCVVQGKAILRLRHILQSVIVEYHLDGKKMQAVDIPPGYTHSIENVGKETLMCIVWASRIQDLNCQDSYAMEV